jgi:hypothetical protein
MINTARLAPLPAAVLGFTRIPGACAVTISPPPGSGSAVTAVDRGAISNGMAHGAHQRTQHLRSPAGQPEEKARIGRLGGLATKPGVYIHVGNAFVQGILSARIRHHAMIAAEWRSD